MADLDQEYRPVIPLARLHEGHGTAVTVDGIEIALFLRNGVIFAVENLCPHQHIPVLAEGELEGTVLSCPMHGWRFDLATGKCVHASCSLRRFDVRLEGEDVCVAIPDEEEPWW